MQSCVRRLKRLQYIARKDTINDTFLRTNSEIREKGCVSFTCIAFAVYDEEGCIRYHLAVFRGGPNGARVEYTSAASIINDYAPVERNGAYTCVWAHASAARDRYLEFFLLRKWRLWSPRRTSMHADEYQGSGRMPRGLFADDSLASVVSCRALSSFAQQRLVSSDIAAIVREMISRCLSRHLERAQRVNRLLSSR